MSEKNADVERAISAFGGLALTYHSFGPVVMRPRLSSDTRPFTYNELGEAEFATGSSESLGGAALGESYPVEGPPSGLAPGPTLATAVRPQPGTVRTVRAGDPLYDTLPVVQPPMVRSLPSSVPPMLSPLQPSVPQPSRAASRPSVQPMPAMQPPLMQAPLVQVPLAQAQAAPVAPPPFFPLLAAALPNATEPTYTPHYPSAAPPNFAGEPGRGGLPEQPQQTGPVQSGLMPTGSVQTDAGAGLSADRRSLTDMFRLLQGRGDGTASAQTVPVGNPAAGFPTGSQPQQGLQAPATTASPFAAEGQALFRRI